MLADVRAWARDWRAWLLLTVTVVFAVVDATGNLERILPSESWEFLAVSLLLAASVALGRPTLSLLLGAITTIATAISVSGEADGDSIALVGGVLLTAVVVTLLAWYIGRERDRADRRIQILGSEGVFDRMFAQHFLPIFVLTAVDGRIVAVNEAACRFYGYPADEFLTKYGWDVATLPEAVVRDALRQPQPLGDRPFETQHRMADGSTRTVEVTAVKSEGDHGALVVVTVRDVSEAVRHREELAETRQMLADTLDGELDHHTILSPVRDDSGAITDFLLVEANRRACQDFGYDHDALVGMSLLRGLPALRRDSGRTLFDRMVAVAESGDAFRVDGYPMDELSQQAGLPAVIDLAVYRTGSTISVVLHDATERVAAAEELAQSRADYQLLADASVDVVFRSVGGRVRYASPAVRRLLGWSPEEVTGSQQPLQVHPEDHAVVAEAQAHPAPGGIVRYQVRLLRRDNTYAWFEVTTSPVAGSPDDVIGTIRNVSTEVLAQRDAERTLEDKRAVMAALPDAWVVARAIRDAEGNVVDFAYVDGNERAAHWHGVRLEHLLSTTMMTIEGEEGSADVAAASAILGTTDTYEADDVPSFMSTRLGRGQAWIDLRAVPMSADRIFYAWRDVTDRHRAEEELQSALNALAQSDNRVREFTERSDEERSS